MSLRAMLAFLLLLLAGCDEFLVSDPFHYGEVEVRTQRRSGEPVSGVDLILYTGTRVLGKTTSRTDGTAQFRYVPAGVMGVQAFPPEAYRPLDLRSGWTETFAMKEGEERPVAFTYLKFGPGTLIVRTEDPEGSPLEGVRLEVFSPDRLVAAFNSGPAGERTFSDLPFGVYGVRALPGRGYQVPGGIKLVEGFIIEDGWTETAHVVLERCLGTIRAVSTEPDGQPLAGIDVTLFESAGDLAAGETDEGGEYDFSDLYCGNYGVRAGILPEYRLISPPTRYVDGLVLGHEQEIEARFTYARCLGAIAVAALDQIGDPVPGLPLLLYSSEGPVAEDVTNSQGRHRFAELPCGNYGIRVGTLPGYRLSTPAAGYVDGLELDYQQELEARFTFVGCHGSISVKVNDQNGSPVPDALLTLYSPEGILDEQRTDAQGQHRFLRVPCGNLGVKITPPTGYTVEEGAGTSYIDGILLESGEEQSLTFTLSDG